MIDKALKVWKFGCSYEQLLFHKIENRPKEEIYLFRETEECLCYNRGHLVKK